MCGCGAWVHVSDGLGLGAQRERGAELINVTHDLRRSRPRRLRSSRQKNNVGPRMKQHDNLSYSLAAW